MSARDEPLAEGDAEIRTYFVREKNALVARGEFSGLYAAWCLHQIDNDLDVPEPADVLAREAIAAMALHAASRPWKESHAWTVEFPDPRTNFFVASDNNSGTLVVRAMAHGLQPLETGRFHAQVLVPGQEPRVSVIDFRAGCFFEAAEIYYERSEQRLTRFFQHGDEDYVMVSAQPDCDEEWLRSLTPDDIRILDKTVDLSLLEKREFQFECGCNHSRILDILAPLFRSDPAALIGSDPAVTVHCPRCGKRHAVTREALEARCAE